MSFRSKAVTVTTDASGDATAYTTERLTGTVAAIIFTYTDYTAGAFDITITGENTGLSLWVESNMAAASKTMNPVAQASLNTSGASLAGVYVPIVLCDERVKIIIAQGGDTKTGTFVVVVDGSGTTL